MEKKVLDKRRLAVLAAGNSSTPQTCGPSWHGAVPSRNLESGQPSACSDGTSCRNGDERSCQVNDKGDTTTLAGDRITNHRFKRGKLEIQINGHGSSVSHGHFHDPVRRRLLIETDGDWEPAMLGLTESGPPADERNMTKVIQRAT